jgi:hypothetical protein
MHTDSVANLIGYTMMTMMSESDKNINYNFLLSKFKLKEFMSTLQCQQLNPNIPLTS